MMNYESHPSKEIGWQKRLIAFSVGIGVLALATACSTETQPDQPSTSQSPSVEHSTTSAPLPELTMLKQYEREAGVAPAMMDFITFPDSEASAREQANTLATTLRAWDDQQTSPILIMEPTFDNGDMMDLDKFARGDYDKTIDTYFATLKEAGVTSEQIGTLVPFPEPNIPDWKDGVTDPSTFIHNTSEVASALKKYFPEAKVSVMLDSVTYLPSPDPNWTNGSSAASELQKYLHFQPGVIDSLGFQGFTWSNEDTPTDYLNADALITAARTLGVKNVWFNTGTYSETYNPDKPSVPLKAADDRRAAILSGVLEEAMRVKDAGLHIDFVNIFGQNTFDSKKPSDGTADFQYKTDKDLAVLKTFVDSAHAQDIPVTIFDAPH